MKKKSFLFFLNKRSNKKTMPSLVSGYSLVEILVAVFIFSLILGSLINMSSIYLSGAGNSLKSTKGAYLALEGIEAVKIIRDTDWATISTLSTNTDYYLFWDSSSSTWKSTLTATTTDLIFTRTFRLSPVYRNIDGDSTTTQALGYTTDENSKKVTVSVSWWAKNSTTTKSLSTYITNIF